MYQVSCLSQSAQRKCLVRSSTKDDHNHEDKKEQGSEGRQTLDHEKAHSTGEFVIVAKFGDHVLSRLASSLSNLIKQAGRQADENLVKMNVLVFGIW